MSGDLPTIQTELTTHGPLSATFSVYDNFYTFFSSTPTGIYTAISGSLVGGHAVVLIGYGTDPVAGTYWLLQNQWGAGWGDNGYFRMKSGIDLCGIDSGLAGIIPNTSAKKRVHNGTISLPKTRQDGSSGMLVGAPIAMDTAFDPQIDIVFGAASDFDPNFEVVTFNGGTSQVVNGAVYDVTYTGSDGSVVNSVISQSNDGSVSYATNVISPALSTGGGLSAGAIAGIVVGSVAGGLLLGLIVVGGAVAAGVVTVAALSRKKPQSARNTGNEGSTIKKPGGVDIYDNDPARHQSITARAPGIEKMSSEEGL